MLKNKVPKFLAIIGFTFSRHVKNARLYEAKFLGKYKSGPFVIQKPVDIMVAKVLENKKVVYYISISANEFHCATTSGALTEEQTKEKLLQFLQKAHNV
jgi:hypothetical protein